MGYMVLLLLEDLELCGSTKHLKRSKNSPSKTVGFNIIRVLSVA